MLPLILLSIAGLSIGASQIINKRLSAKDHRSSSLTTTIMLMNALVSIPLLFVEFYISHSMLIWFLILISIVVFALSTYFKFRAFKLIDVSSVTIIQRLNVVFVAFLGIVLLGELYTTTSYIGLFLILAGGLIMVYNKQKIDLNLGVIFALLMAFTGAIASLLDKIILNDFSPYTYVFINNLLVGMVFLPRKGVIGDSIDLFKNNKVAIIVTSLLGTVSFLLVLIILQDHDVSKTMPIYKSVGLLTTVLMGIFILKEKGQLYQKIIGSILSIAGIVLLTI